MLQNWDAFFKWFVLLTDKISLSHTDLNELSEIRLSCDSASYHIRRRIFCTYIGLLISSVLTDLLGCSVPKLSAIIGCSKQRLYRIESGQVIQGLYEIFCILYVAGLPFPAVFDDFVSERLALLRKHRTSAARSPETDEIQEAGTEVSSRKIVHAITETSNTCVISVGIYLPAGNHLSDRPDPAQNQILNVICSEDGEISFRLPKPITANVHYSNDLSVKQESTPLSQSEERTIQKKSGIRDTSFTSLEVVSPNSYLSPGTSTDILNTGGSSCKKHLHPHPNQSI